jgi:chemotaxis protein CheX
MEVDDLKIFLTGTARYFEKYLQEPCQVDPPYLKDKESIILDYAGMIGVTGKERGAVYFTANGEMLTDMLRVMVPKDMEEIEQQVQAMAPGSGQENEREKLLDEACLDIVGEVANTIAGNSREHFGEDFNISVPIRMRVKADQVQFPKNSRSFVVPIAWRQHRAFLIICVE